jgi:hypothetical protein
MSQGWTCDLCGQHAQVKLNGRELCLDHFDSELQALVAALKQAGAKRIGTVLNLVPPIE